MIRVNLLPIRKARRRSQGIRQLALFAGVVAIEIIIFGAIYLYFADELSQVESEVEDIRAEVSELEEQTAGIDDLQAEAQELGAQLEVLANLEARRIGPVQMLDELQAMVSSPRNEDDRRQQMLSDWNVDWNPHRLWLENFQETEESGFTLEGFAANADDVAEFLQRMTSARYFNNVDLRYVERESGDTDLVSFHMYGDLDYTGFESPDS